MFLISAYILCSGLFEFISANTLHTIGFCHFQPPVDPRQDPEFRKKKIEALRVNVTLLSQFYPFY